MIRVSSTTDPAQAGGAIAHHLREHSTATVQAIGAGAVNQAVKALSVAGSMLKDDGYSMLYSSRFLTVIVNDKTRTAIQFRAVAVRIREVAQ